MHYSVLKNEREKSMSENEAVAAHYVHGSLLKSIAAALPGLGKTTETVTIADLGPVDEFHIGGRVATNAFLSQLKFSEQAHVLDVGCGLGGASRFAAETFKTKVSGIDLTHEYIETGRALNTWVGLGDKINLQQGSALAMPFPDGHFDGGFMLHVGMNIEDKGALFKEIARVLRPGSAFGVYDIMRMNDGNLIYPVPWASENKICSVATLDAYRSALGAAGFEISAERNRRDFALESFKAMREKTAANGGPPPLSLHTLMKAQTATKIKNLVDNISGGRVAPVEMIAHK